MIKETITVDEVIDILNGAIVMDREAIDALVNQRIECNESLADHPHIQVRPGKSLSGTAIWSVGLLGILNGLFGIDDISGYGAITAVINDDSGILEKFIRTKGPELQV